MKQSKKVAAQPAAAVKPPRKLTPRTAPAAKVEATLPAQEPAVAAPPAAPAPAAGPATAAASAKARPARKPSAVNAAVARHQKVLADALATAQAIPAAVPPVEAPVVEAARAKKPARAPKAKKPKLVRDSYAMPETEYARIGELKKRLAGLGNEVKKSELLRAGVAVLAALGDAELQAVIGRVERIKTGRPSK